MNIGHPHAKECDIALRDFFKLESFRLGQREVIEAILQGHDTLAIMPTGGGKSLCYQLPALMMDGVALVISPLISLMQDQVTSLENKGIPATFINSTLSATEQSARLRAITAGNFKLIYIAPERFRQSGFMHALSQIKVGFIAIDEAHCISQWGHDFRPDYLKLGPFFEKLGNPRIAAFTATATPEVQEDILKNLKMREPKVFVSGFARTNLEFRVTHTAKVVKKYERLRNLISTHQTGIIYCSTRKQVEQVAEQLVEWDIAHVQYHAGMTDDERKNAQDLFMQKRTDVAVATNAFGMGIDRSDVRFVAHFQVPGSVEAYYQEAGRAGRDGHPSVCELLFNYRDRQIQEFFIEGSNPSQSLIRRLYTHLCDIADNAFEVRLSIDEITEALGKGTNGMSVSSALSYLNTQGYIERFDIPGQRIRGTKILNPSLLSRDLKIDEEALQIKETRDRRKLDLIVKYAYDTQCRQLWMLHYFGDVTAKPCGKCDICIRRSRAIISRPSNETEDEFYTPQNDNPYNSEDAYSHFHAIRLPNDEELIIVQKVLSGVARMSFKDADLNWQPRYGRGKIIEMLLGVRNEAMQSAKLDQLSTYGILKELDQSYLKSLFEELEVAGLLVKSKREHYELVTLSKLGDQAMRGKVTYKLKWPASSKRSHTSNDSTTKKPTVTRLHTPLKEPTPSNEISIDPKDQALLAALKEKRKELSHKLCKPVYLILNNRTLEMMAQEKPRNLLEAQNIPGVGPVKIRTILPHFLEVIEEYCNR